MLVSGLEWLDDSVDEAWVIESSHVTRLLPFDGEGRNVGENHVELFGGDITGKRNGIEAGATDGGIRKQAGESDAAFAPALGQARIFQDWKHQAVVAGLLDGNVTNSGGDSACGGESSRRAEGLINEVFDCGSDGNVPEWRGRKIHADVGPTGFAVNAKRVTLDFHDLVGEHAGEFCAGIVNVGGAAKRFGDDICGFEADGELMAETRVIGSREIGCQRLYLSDGPEIEIALTVFCGVFELFNGSCGRPNGAPTDAVVSSDDNAAANMFGIGDDFCKKVGLGFRIVCVEHGGTDARHELLLFRERIEVFEKCDSLLRGEAFGVFREWLRGDADSLDFVAARFERGFGAAEH